jgi:hypothetical protein
MLTIKDVDFALKIALSPIIFVLGHIPTPKEMGRILDGHLSAWGRILNG